MVKIEQVKYYTPEEIYSMMDEDKSLDATRKDICNNNPYSMIINGIWHISIGGYLMSGISSEQQKQCELISQLDFNLTSFSPKGKILDVGGGGEGVIGSIFPQKTIAIDISKQELEEAKEGPVKIVMDATDMQFLDKTFDTVTCFFSLMYMSNDMVRKVLNEVYRVLKNDGILYMWDLYIDKDYDTKKDILVSSISVKTKKGYIHTAYGRKRPDKNRMRSYYEEEIKGLGFKIDSWEEVAKNGFYGVFKK